MNWNRRDFLLFLGTATGTLALNSIAGCQTFGELNQPNANELISFEPVKSPIPLPTDGISLSKQLDVYRSYVVEDNIVLPEGFSYDIIASWGDRLGNSRFGYNNDYLSFVPINKDEGYLTINFEYISPKVWQDTFEKVIGAKLPFDKVIAAIKKNGDRGLNPRILSDAALKNNIEIIAKQALIDMGIGVVLLKKNRAGKWQVAESPVNRRITGISGLGDNNYLKVTGPAVSVFKKGQVKGYQDKLGDRIIGTFQNCAGGTSPWGTVFSAEENFQNVVPEMVYPDGSSFDPALIPFRMTEDDIEGLGNVFGLAGNKYGWMVEVDPANKSDYGTKHSWLGRYRHEAVGIRAETNKHLAFYSGCDRQGGHLYKFVSSGKVGDPKDKANSKLLSDGMLYVAKFNSDGSGVWIPLEAKTAINPDFPKDLVGGILYLPLRPQGGVFAAKNDADILAFKKKYRVLGELYEGNPLEKQGAILIDAHYAASAIGATCTARPEDTQVAPDGSLFVTFTSGSSSERNGGPDLRIFAGSDGKSYEYGWIMRLVEDNNDPASLGFSWSMFAMGGEPSDSGMGFANPDNIEFDAKGNIWMVTDMSTGRHNFPIPSRNDEESKPFSQSKLRGLFGNNSIWYIPTSGPDAGKCFLFGIGPMECELTGPFFTPDQTTLFLAVQHPGELNGIRSNERLESRLFAVKDLKGGEFIQKRIVPIGSNWPSGKPNDPPKPAIVAIHRVDREAKIV